LLRLVMPRLLWEEPVSEVPSPVVLVGGLRLLAAVLLGRRGRIDSPQAQDLGLVPLRVHKLVEIR
jgi:hypothetical protein